jgi:hypothetical protein
MTRRTRGAFLGPAGCLAALLHAAPAAAAPPVSFCGLPQKPLLTVSSHRFMSFGAVQVRATTFIFTDGAVVQSESVEAQDPHASVQSSLPRSAFVARGTASPDVFASFVSALLAARPGAARDCFNTVNDTGDFTDYRLTWFGKGQRKNTFLDSTQVAGPDCGPAIDHLIERTLAVVGSALNPPAAEILTSGPFQ